MINTSFMSRKERFFYFRLMEFNEELSENKFQKGSNLPKFKSGERMGYWFYKNIDIIKEMNNEVARNVIRKYNMSRFNLNEKILLDDSDKKIFETKIEEFAKEKNADKFMFLSKSPLFKDKTHMGIWFVDNKHIILTSNNCYCEEVKKQYKNYLMYEMNLTADEKYEKRLIEFCKEKDYNKFKNESGIMFSDGKSMPDWYYENEEKIESANDKFSPIIKAQFKYYTKIKDILKVEKRQELYRRKLLLFMQESDYDKFSQLGFIEFKDGSNMGTWFNRHKSTILNSNDAVSNEIKRQYNEYLRTKDRFNNIKKNHK